MGKGEAQVASSGTWPKLIEEYRQSRGLSRGELAARCGRTTSGLRNQFAPGREPNLLTSLKLLRILKPEARHMAEFLQVTGMATFFRELADTINESGSYSSLAEETGITWFSNLDAMVAHTRTVEEACIKSASKSLTSNESHRRLVRESLEAWEAALTDLAIGKNIVSAWDEVHNKHGELHSLIFDAAVNADEDLAVEREGYERTMESLVYSFVNLSYGLRHVSAEHVRRQFIDGLIKQSDDLIQVHHLHHHFAEALIAGRMDHATDLLTLQHTWSVVDPKDIDLKYRMHEYALGLACIGCTKRHLAASTLR
jgi:hypothetical protein